MQVNGSKDFQLEFINATTVYLIQRMLKISYFMNVLLVLIYSETNKLGFQCHTRVRLKVGLEKMWVKKIRIKKKCG